jgi:hypothetical protein
MIRLLIIVFALIVALGAGAGGLIQFGILPDFTGMIVPPGQDAGGQETAGTAEDAPVVRVDPVFLDMPPILVPIIRQGVLERNIYIALRLKVVPGQEQAARYHSQALHDVYVRALYDQVPRQMEKRQTLDLQRLKDRLFEITERVVGKGVVEAVLVQAVFER